MEIILIHFARKYKGDWEAIYKALNEKEHIPLKEMQETQKWVKDNEANWRVVTVIDEDYPFKFKNIYKPPFVLWYKGSLSKVNLPLMCVTGDKEDEVTSKRITKIMSELVNEYSVLSLSMKGVDEQILGQSKSNVIVLASGLDQPGIHHEANEEKDLLIGEYPPEAHATKETYKWRNRIAAGLSDSLLLFSSQKHGGINGLINQFLNYGKEIYCLPGDGEDNDGNSELIKQGAHLVTSWKDIKN